MLQPCTQDVIARALRLAGNREVCGFLLVDAAGEQRFFAVRNWAGGSGSFAVAASEHRRVQRHAHRQALSIQAFLHSHREGLELSKTDRTGMEATQLPWIVVCLCGEELQYQVHSPFG